jgi:hypothetical protein
MSGPSIPALAIRKFPSADRSSRIAPRHNADTPRNITRLFKVLSTDAGGVPVL